MCVRDKGSSVIVVWALKITKGGGSGGSNQLDYREYTPLYEKGIKKTENKSMETTKCETQSEGGWESYVFKSNNVGSTW